MRTLFLAVGLSVLSFAPLAQAEEIRIPVMAADVQSDAAVAALYARIEAAAVQICQLDTPSPLEISRARHSCVSATVDQAVHDANIAQLTAYHATETAPAARSATLASR